MTTTTLEIYNIVLIIFLVIDYIKKYSKQLTQNSFVWFFYSFFVCSLSILNIIIFEMYSSNVLDIQLPLVKLGFYLTLVPILAFTYYIDINYFEGLKNKKRALLYIIVFFVLVLVFHVFFNLSAEPQVLLSHMNGYKPYNSLMILSLFPIVVLVGLNWAFDKKIDRRILFLSVVVFTGFLIAYFFEGITITHVLTISALMLYSIKYDSTINNDHLTGAYNRRFLDSYKLSSKKLYSLFVIDIDKFKFVNDTYGPDIGDKLLIELVSLLNHSVRTNDVVVRTGGDEFVIIATIKNKEDIDILKKRILYNIEKRNEKNNIKLSISIGSSVYTTKDNFLKIYKKVDSLMYKEKKKKNEETPKIKNNLGR